MPSDILKIKQLVSNAILEDSKLLSTSTTAVCPVNIVLASTTLCSLGVALISHRHMVWSSDALNKYPFKLGFHDKPYPSFWWPLNLYYKIQIF